MAFSGQIKEERLKVSANNVERNKLGKCEGGNPFLFKKEYFISKVIKVSSHFTERLVD